jgi:hypothetical protein
MAKKEIVASELHMEQPSDVLSKVGEPLERPDSAIVKLNGIEVTKDYLEEIKFMEEPVTVNFFPVDEKFGAPFVYAYNNGKGMEVSKIGDLDFGRWVERIQVPTGVSVVIKRKYLGIFATAKTMNVRADYTKDGPDGEPVNRLHRSVTLRHPFSVVHDPNPRGQVWLQNLIASL